MYREGQTATNPKTGQKIVYKGGQWVNGGAAPPRPGKLSPQEQIQLKEAREGSVAAQDFARQANLFVDLNKKSGTGLINKIPFVSEVRSAFDPNLAQMDALTSRMAPAQRVPGSGTTSDRDLALYLKAVPNVDRPGEANAAIARDMTTTAKQRADRAAFLDRWAAERGTLMGAEEAWNARSTRAKAAPPGARNKPSLDDIFK
jgi:hypothetical protein